MANKNKISNQSGIALAATIMMIVFVSIVVFNVTIFIVQRLSDGDAKRIQARCINLAHAGIQQALYDFRVHDNLGTGYFSLGPTSIDANNSFTLGGDPAGSAADWLIVNTQAANLSGSDLTGITIQDATNSKAITIDRIQLTWDNARSLSQVRINGTNYWTGPNDPTPADANLDPDFPLAASTPPVVYSINRFRFGGNMTNPVAPTFIDATFVMTDGSTKTLRIYPASHSTSNNFTVKSTGKTANSNIYRTLQADYRASMPTGTITNYKEINVQATP